MKRLHYVLILFVVFIFSKCEKVIDVDVPSIAPKLIIDAAFEVNFDETPVTANTVVKLRLSADYFDTELPIVTNATVYVTNLNSNSVINFNDINLDGNYVPDVSFIPEDDIPYELTIIYNGETFKGQATKAKSTPFTNVVQGDETLFSGKETEVKVNFTDDANANNFYLFDFTNSLFLAIEDRFFNGSDYNFSFFYGEDDIELPATVNIKMSGITEQYFTYFRVLIDQSGQNAGGPFETIPASLVGNMVNTTNPNEFPLGYFHISETDTFTLNLVEKD